MEFMTIAGVAHELQMTVPAVRHLLRKSKIIEDRRLYLGRPHGFRIFFDEDVEKLREYLRSQG